MFKKMMKHLVNNPGLKVLSILISVVLWLAVVKMADPESTKSFSVPVEILNNYGDGEGSVCGQGFGCGRVLHFRPEELCGGHERR